MSAFCPPYVFMCSLMILIISGDRFPIQHPPICLSFGGKVFCAVRTSSLCVMWINFSLHGVNEYQTLAIFQTSAYKQTMQTSIIILHVQKALH